MQGALPRCRCQQRREVQSGRDRMRTCWPKPGLANGHLCHSWVFTARLSGHFKHFSVKGDGNTSVRSAAGRAAEALGTPVLAQSTGTRNAQ